MISREEFLAEHNRIISAQSGLSFTLDSILEYPIDVEWGRYTVETKAHWLSPHQLHWVLSEAIRTGKTGHVYVMLPANIMHPANGPDTVPQLAHQEARAEEQYTIVGREALLAVTTTQE